MNSPMKLFDGSHRLIRHAYQSGLYDDLDDIAKERVIASNKISLMASAFLVAYIVIVFLFQNDHNVWYFLLPGIASILLYLSIPIWNRYRLSIIPVQFIAFIPIILVTYMNWLIGTESGFAQVIILAYPVMNLFMFPRKSLIFKVFYIASSFVILFVNHFYLTSEHALFPETDPMIIFFQTCFIFFSTGYIIYHSTNLFKDRLDRKRKVIEKNYEILFEQNRRITKLMAHKERLSNIVVQELINPLKSIASLSQKSISQEESDFVNKEGKKMLNLVYNILDIQKFEDEKMVLNRLPWNLSELVNGALKEVKFFNTQTETPIEYKNTSKYLVHVDGQLVMRVIINIILHNLQNLSETDKIEVATIPAEDDGWVRILITGYQPSVIGDRIADLSRELLVDDRLEGADMSAGFALTYCKIAIHAHGGEINIPYIIDKGKVISFTLPLYSGSRLPEAPSI